ncbi:hypothetical protein BGZ98_001969 [Dissophora globulifera]|nr:hypothetical protein BGZ98_001969 [Dissophora globulifera]
MFMHNGSIADFHLIKRKIQESLPDDIYLSVNGNTDSEWAFAVFLSQLATPRQTEPFCHTVLQDALIRTIRLFNAWSKDAAAATISNNKDGISPSSSTPSFFNFAVTDGDTVVCTRYVNSRHMDALSLYFSSGTRFECYDTRSGRYKMIKEARREDIVLIASEPLTFEEADWREVPRNSIVVVTSRMNVLTYPIIDEFYEAIPSLATTNTETVDTSMRRINTTTVVIDTDMEDIESARVDKEELQYTQHPEFAYEESSGASTSLSDFSAASMSVASYDSIASSSGTLLSSWPSSPSHHSNHQNQHQQYLVPPLSPSTSSISTESLHLSDVAMHEDRSKVGMMLEKRPRERESTRGDCDYGDGFDSDIEEDYRIFRVRRRF